MSEFHPPVYCENQYDWFLDNDWHSSTVSTKGNNDMHTASETKTAPQIVSKLPEPKRRRTIEDIKKWQPIMEAFEKMIAK